MWPRLHAGRSEGQVNHAGPPKDHFLCGHGQVTSSLARWVELLSILKPFRHKDSSTIHLFLSSTGHLPTPALRVSFKAYDSVAKLIVITVAQLCKHIKIHGTSHFTWVDCMVDKLHFNKDKEEKEGQEETEEL